MRVLVGLAALFALGLAPPAAGAATLSYTQFLPGGPDSRQAFAQTDWDGTTQTVTLPQFNPARGTLTGVDLELYGEALLSGSLTNNTQQAITLNSYAATQEMTLQAPGMTDPLTVSPGVFSSAGWRLDPGGSVTFGADAPVDANDSGSAAVSSLAPYAGTDNLELPLSVVSNTDADTGGDGTLDIARTTRARAAATITYTYDVAATAVPEPASALLLGTGLLGLRLLRRRS